VVDSDKCKFHSFCFFKKKVKWTMPCQRKRIVNCKKDRDIHSSISHYGTLMLEEFIQLCQKFNEDHC
jgi:hypothetical protein